MFYILSNHADLFGFPASWNYFEAGHGKGPCDGVGGSVKRMADEAVKQQKVVLQDAKDFFAWTQSIAQSPKINYKFVPKDQCEAAEKRNVFVWHIVSTTRYHEATQAGREV